MVETSISRFEALKLRVLYHICIVKYVDAIGIRDLVQILNSS